MTPPTDHLPPTPPPTRVATLYRARWPLLLAYIAAVVALAAICILHPKLGLPWGAACLLLAAILVFQALFLLGMPQLRWPKPVKPVPMTVSIATGALLAALLTCGIAASLLNLVKLWERLTATLEGNVFWAIPIAWGAWFFLFAVMWAGEWLAIFRRIYRVLIAGTCLELLITIPIDAHVRRRTSCYCGEGTFFAMVIGTSLAIWSFGPGLALLFLTRRLQLRGHFATCRNCAYDLRGLPTETKHCPECGTRIPEKFRELINQ